MEAVKKPELSPDNKDTNQKNEQSGKNKISFRQTFAALKHPNYRLWFQGQLISLFGSWMQTTAQGYFVYELTKSPVFLGYVGFASGIPAWLFTFYAGVIADRFPRRIILLLTQFWLMFLAFILAFLTFTNLVQPWHIILLSFGVGIGNAFDAPARHAFVNELVDKKDLVNAIAMNSTMFNTATAIGPAIAGITYALFGPAWCFTINGISFIAVIINLYRINLQKETNIKTKGSVINELKSGFRYLISQKMIIVILLITSFTSLFGLALVTLFPVWAVKILHGNSATNGFLQSARGVGAVLTALFIASVSHFNIKGRLLWSGFAVLPFLLIIFAFNNSLLLSLFLLVLTGGSLILIFNLSNGIIQTLVSEEFRGRIMSIYTFSFFAFMPIGSLFIGFLAEHLNVVSAIIINALILLCSVTYIFFRFPGLRKIR